MDVINQFLFTFISYIREMWLPIAAGFLLSGIIDQFIPDDLIERHFGQKGVRPILWSTLAGTILPVCCFGTLPIAVTLRNKGARLGPVLAFLVATPATSLSALLVTWKMLGFPFAVYLFFSVIIMGIVMGLIGNLIHSDVKNISTPQSQPEADCCHTKEAHGHTIFEKFKDAFIYAFITLPKEIGPQLLIGIAVASFVVIFSPLQNFIHTYLTGTLGFGAVLVVGLADYVCSTASVPLADALIKSGMTPGHAMSYLILGPVTSYGTLLVILKEFGRRVLSLYLMTISVLSIVFGVLYNFLPFR